MCRIEKSDSDFKIYHSAYLEQINPPCSQYAVSYKHIVCAIQMPVMKSALNKKRISAGNQLGNSKHCSRSVSSKNHFVESQNLENYVWLNQWGHMALVNSFSMSNAS